jgi:hypothetical protein
VDRLTALLARIDRRRTAVFISHLLGVIGLARIPGAYDQFMVIATSESVEGFSLFNHSLVTLTAGLIALQGLAIKQWLQALGMLGTFAFSALTILLVLLM